MADIDTFVAVYSDILKAENDWAALESAAEANEIKLTDGALVENRDGEVVTLKRQEHHGWGKGAIVGAVVGIYFPAVDHRIRSRSAPVAVLWSHA